MGDMKYEIDFNESLIKEHNGWEDFETDDDIMKEQVEFD